MMSSFMNSGQRQVDRVRVSPLTLCRPRQIKHWSGEIACKLPPRKNLGDAKIPHLFNILCITYLGVSFAFAISQSHHRRRMLHDRSLQCGRPGDPQMISQRKRTEIQLARRAQQNQQTEDDAELGVKTRRLPRRHRYFPPTPSVSSVTSSEAIIPSGRYRP